MANPINNLNYANTFADWMVATNYLAAEVNTLGKGDYHKDTGTLFTDGTLQANGKAYFQNDLRSQGAGSSVTIDNNVTVKYGTIYINKALDSDTSNIALVAHGQANVDGLLFANGPSTGLYVTNDSVVGGNSITQYTATANHVHANSSIYTPLATVTSGVTTNNLQANNRVLTGTVQANNYVYTNIMTANSATYTNTSVANTAQINVSSNTETAFSNVSYSHYVTANNAIYSPRGNIESLTTQTLVANTLSVSHQFTVDGNFILNGDTVYNSSEFIINSASDYGLNSEFSVNRGLDGDNASLRWNNDNSYWDARGTGAYYRIVTQELVSNSISSTSETNVASSKAVYNLGLDVRAAGSYANAAFAYANTFGVLAQPIYNKANAAFSQANVAFAQANNAYQAANLSVNYITGTTGQISPISGTVVFASNNGVTLTKISPNSLAINTPQDLRTTANPTFNNLSLTNPLGVDQGGTGATTNSQALNNLLPSGTYSGYVLTTGGEGNYYWASVAGSTEGGVIPGTTISSTRLSYTANGAAGYTGNTFAIPVASQGNQVRAYVDGVRQFESEYTLNLNANTITFSTGPSNGNKVLIEVDGYYVNPYYANNITYGPPTGSIPSSANTIQLAIDSLENRKAALNGATFTGLTTGITVNANSANAHFATTAFVKNVLNSGNTYSHSIVGNVTGNVSGNAGTVTNGVYTTSTYSDPSWITSLAASKITDLANSAITDTSNATNIISGTLDVARLGTSQNPQFNSIGIGTGASGTAGQVLATGDVISGYSDDRLKTKLGNIENALSKVSSLNGFYYEPNETAKQFGYGDKKQVGVSAQEVQSVVPEIVESAPIGHDYLTVNYERLVPLLIEAIKELKAEVDALKGNNK